MINGSPQVMSLAIDPHENLIQMPAPLRPGPHLCGTLLLDFSCERRAEPIPPEPHGLVANIDPSFMKQVLDLPQRQRKSNTHHHGQADDLGRGLEIAEWVAHPRRLRDELYRLKPVSSDNAIRVYPIIAPQSLQSRTSSHQLAKLQGLSFSRSGGVAPNCNLSATTS